VRSTKREQLIETALGLFYRHGYHATGIERILAESGVARMTLYKHFRSKDELILAALERRSARFIAWLEMELARAAPGAARLLALFDALGRWIAGRAGPGLPFEGCAFINATAEFADPENPVHRAAAAHKRQLKAMVQGLAAEAGADDPEALADELMLLMEGTIVTAQVSGDRGAAKRARALAERIVVERCGAMA
jgi:AcrR family transcriptional regulator